MSCIQQGEDDFQSVHDAVGTLAGVWWPFGAALGLSPSSLREIDQADRGIPAQCLFNAIDKWLRQDYNEKHGLPSWRRLVIAVESNTGGQNAALAKKIAQSHRIGEYHITHIIGEYHITHIIGEYHIPHIIV